MPATLQQSLKSLNAEGLLILLQLKNCTTEAWESILNHSVFCLQDWMNVWFNFAFYYPLIMTYFWITGALIYYFRWEKSEHKRHEHPPILSHYPPVSILVPCHNEGADIKETIEFLLLQTYPNFEIITINDGSTDNTVDVLLELAKQHDCVRVINLEQNQGKAVALRTGALFSKNEFLICIDGDALLAPTATAWIMMHFLSGARVAAVTGNPRIRTRSTLIGKIQVGEFSAIIGLIKRAQRIYGRIFTVSGVVAGFRKAALHQVGYWSIDMVTDDIDISWKLQLDKWDIRYEPNVLCWILMPETLSGLWKQRLRWAQGGAEVLMKYSKQILFWKSRRMWGIYVEYLTSVIWAFSMMLIFILWFLGCFINLPKEFDVPSLLPSWGGMFLGLTCLGQFMVSLLIDSRYEKKIFQTYYWIVWYPLVFWLLNVVTSGTGFIKAIFKKRNARAIWTSPDRGVR